MTYIENIKEFIDDGYKVKDLTCNRKVYEMRRMLWKYTSNNTRRC